MADKVLRKPAVEQMTGLDQVTLWRRERQRRFSPKNPLGLARRWLAGKRGSELWLEKRAAERPPPTNEHEGGEGFAGGLSCTGEDIGDRRNPLMVRSFHRGIAT